MKLAVLLSSYNGEKYIRQQIDSILAQTGDFQLELWVRDDGSTDGTHAILTQYAQQGKLRWYTGENLKPAHSFLDLIHHCPGYDYYAFADQDDYWLPDKLSRGVTRLKTITGPGLFFANAQLVDAQLGSLGRNVYRTCPALDFYTLSCAGGLLGCTMVFNRALAELVYDAPMPGKIFLHDYYLAVLCTLFDGTILYDDAPRMQYRQHGSNVVGVARSKGAALKNRLQTVTRRAKVTAGQQAASLLAAYPQLPAGPKRRWLEQLAATGDAFTARIRVAASSKTHYPNLEKSLTLRCAMLLGNR